MTAYNDEDENLMADRRRTDLDQKALEAAYAKSVELKIDVNSTTKAEARAKIDAIIATYLAALPGYATRGEHYASPSFPAVVPSGWVTVPSDDLTREFANSTLPVEMIHAGMDVLEKVDEDNANYVAGETIDWDNGMVAVAVYRAMLAAAPPPPLLDGADREGIYIASKTKHAERWRILRALGVPIIATWIDEAGEGESQDLQDLWRRCLSEAAGAAAIIVYREPDEVLKGGWIELGAAASHGVPVFAVGIEEFTIARHNGIEHFASFDAALAAAMRSVSKGQP